MLDRYCQNLLTLSQALQIVYVTMESKISINRSTSIPFWFPSLYAVLASYGFVSCHQCSLPVDPLMRPELKSRICLQLVLSKGTKLMCLLHLKKAIAAATFRASFRG